MSDPQHPIPTRRPVNDLARQQAAARRAAPSRPPVSAQAAAQEPPTERIFPQSDDPQFSRGPARRPAPRVADPLLQWATGLTTKERQIYAGWLVEAGVRLDLDNAMEAAGFARITIKHGSGNLVTHWAIEAASVFVICEGVQSIAEMKHTAERYGIAFGWRTLENGRSQSQLRLRCFLRELLCVGYTEPLTLSLKSTLTGDLIAALLRQYDVLDAIGTFRAESGKPPLALPFYACSIPLGPGEEVARGREQTREITPMVAQIPSPVTKEHVKAHWIRREWVGLIEGLLDETVAWSVAASAEIGAPAEPMDRSGGEDLL